MLRRTAFALAILASLLAPAQAVADEVLRVGSKRFTESYVLAEVLTQAAAARGAARHLQGLGNTAILFEALRQGSIDLYPEYLGTIELEILKRDAATGSLPSVNEALAPLGLKASIPLGFDNTYALAVRPDTAATLPSQTIGALAGRPGLRFGLSHEFLGRADGWRGLKARYALPQQAIGLDHGLAYQALDARSVDVIDVYSTDARIAKHGVVVLADDLGWFPRYDAVVLHRLDLPQRFPDAWSALESLAGRVDRARMIALNGAVELDGRSFAEVAAAFLDGSRPPATARAGLWRKLAAEDFWRLGAQHLALVAISVSCAALIGVPAGVAAAWLPRAGGLMLAAAGALQTVPSLALLAFLISAIGAIGTLPALVALFAYALLPIVRNTCVGITQIPPGIRDAAIALGMGARDRIRFVELPLALPMILAGIRTAAVVAVGTATIAAFIGAGGFGERISIGLALNDPEMLLAGALPAAALAFLVEAAFALAGRLAGRAPPRAPR